MRPKYILFFDDNSEFSDGFAKYLKAIDQRIIHVQQTKIHDWQFRLYQNSLGQHFGNVICPINQFYDFGEIHGLFINDFIIPSESNYEYNAWHALLAWMMHTLTNTYINFYEIGKFNIHHLYKVLEENGIGVCDHAYTHIAHCLNNNIYLSTKNNQMALLPPKIANKLLATIATIGQTIGQFHLNYSNNSWHCCGFNLQPDWSSCAFPKQFIYADLLRTLTKDKPMKWHFCPTFRIDSRKARIPKKNFIAQKLIPSLTGSMYNPPS